MFFGLSSGTVAGASGNIASALMLFFDFSVGYILTLYSSFVTLTAMKIFTLEGEPALEGVMFSAKRFRGIFNFRFILSYILFFILFSVAGLFVSILKTQLLTLI
jgi:hypothetical protein